MNGKIILEAPAKINLTLEVTGKRADGYHTISSLMQSISLCDRISAEHTDGSEILAECSTDEIPSGNKNIAYKAAEAFFEYSGIERRGIRISIDKEIPSQAGLGGGSSDAAAVLCGMNRLFETGYSAEELCRIGVTVGADVPFCIVGGTKWCKGIGEIISEAPPLQDCYIVIGKGSEGISTKEAYERIDSLGFSEDFSSNGYDGTIDSVLKIGRNIFEEVSDLESVSEIKKICLSCGAEYSEMSGSGSAVFGIFPEADKARNAAEILSKNGYFGSICQPINYGAYFLSNRN